MKQITIVTRAENGILAKISRKLGDQGINIESIEAMDVHDQSVVTMTVDSYDQALTILRDSGYSAVTEDAVVINIKDEPGSLARVTERLHDGGIHVQSIRILYRQFGEAIVAVTMHPKGKGIKTIRDLLVSRSDD